MKRKSSSHICLPRVSLSLPDEMPPLQADLILLCIADSGVFFWGGGELKAYNSLVLSKSIGVIFPTVLVSLHVSVSSW